MLCAGNWNTSRMHRRPAWSACWLQLKGETVNKSVWTRVVAIGAAVMLTVSMAQANGYREKNMVVKVAKSAMKATPARDWNSLSIRPGKKAETWTLDGEQLDDVTFYGGIAPGEPDRKSTRLNSSH